MDLCLVCDIELCECTADADVKGNGHADVAEADVKGHGHEEVAGGLKR